MASIMDLLDQQLITKTIWSVKEDTQSQEMDNEMDSLNT